MTKDADLTHRLWRDGARKTSAPDTAIEDLLRKVGRVLELHRVAAHPARELVVVCPWHTELKGDVWRHWPELEECEHCVTSTYKICEHCVCPNDRWPCATYLALFPEENNEPAPVADIGHPRSQA